MIIVKKSIFISTFTAVLSLVVFAPPGRRAVPINAAEDFSDSSNPNSAWSYGWSYGLASAFHLDVTNSSAYAGLALGGWLGNRGFRPGARLSVCPEKTSPPTRSPTTARPFISPDNSACSPVPATKKALSVGPLPFRVRSRLRAHSPGWICSVTPADVQFSSTAPHRYSTQP